MQTKQYKFVLLGDTNSGKTCIARRFCESDKPEQTRSANPNSKSIKTSYQSEGNFDLSKAPYTAIRYHTKSCDTSINILDIAGDYKHGAAFAVKKHEPDGIIIVVDSTNDEFDAESFKEWLQIATNNSNPTAPIYICLSKNDDASDDCTGIMARIVLLLLKTPSLNGRKKAILPCSAQQNTKIEALFDRLLQDINPSLVIATKTSSPETKKASSSQATQETKAASTGWYDFFFKNYPNWLIGLIVLSLLIEFANLGLQILSFFPEGQFLALGLSFDYAAPTMHAVLWIGISLITWGGCALLKKTLATSSESTISDNPPHKDSTSLQTNTSNTNAAAYKPLVNPVPTQHKSAGKPTLSEEDIKAPEEFCTLF